MPASKKQSNRKDKTYTPMTKKALPVVDTTKPIYRQPVWSADEIFAINGSTLEMLANFVQPFRSLIQMVDSVMTTGELEGKIDIAFFYENRELVTDADPRLAGLKDQELKRLSHWRTLVEEKQKDLQALAEKSKAAEAAMNSDNIDEIIANFSKEEKEAEAEINSIPEPPAELDLGVEIPFNKK
jgi:hypothetical protein